MRLSWEPTKYGKQWVAKTPLKSIAENQCRKQIHD
jgi:hypothetical protein